MIQEVLQDIFRVEIPLPRSPLRAVNSYLIKGGARNLIIDPGMNHPDCLDAMQTALKNMSADLGKTDFFITHFHPDHLGLVSELAGDKSRIYLSEKDALRLDKIVWGNLWTEMNHFTVRNGFPAHELQELIRVHPRERFGFKKRPMFHHLREGDTVSIGNVSLKYVETPGHTKGHVCLHEPTLGILFAGDHILGKITPNISLRSDTENPLKEYLESLEKVLAIHQISIVLPGHGAPFGDCRRRIEELEQHHRLRLEELTYLLRRGKLSAYQIASQIAWDVPFESWDHFPVFQKWIAVGEVMAHARYLEDKGILVKETTGGTVLFSLS